MADDVLVVVASDLHISHLCPVARSAEPDWYAAQAVALDELRALTETHRCPLVVAGDVFDRWNVPPETINFAIDRLPKCYAVPGQHDLPNHRYDQRHRSAYWTLVRAGVISDLEYGADPMQTETGALLVGFPWGCPFRPASDEWSLPSLAVVHAYVWTAETGHPGADETSRVGSRLKELAGYTGIVTGDNHQGFRFRNLMNPGVLTRRKTDERAYRPRVGLWRKSGRFEEYFVNTSYDSWADPVSVPQAAAFDAGGFVRELRTLADGDSLDFRDAVRLGLDRAGATNEVRGLVSCWLGAGV